MSSTFKTLLAIFFFLSLIKKENPQLLANVSKMTFLWSVQSFHVHLACSELLLCLLCNLKAKFTGPLVLFSMNNNFFLWKIHPFSKGGTGETFQTKKKAVYRMEERSPFFMLYHILAKVSIPAHFRVQLRTGLQEARMLGRWYITIKQMPGKASYLHTTSPTFFSSALPCLISFKVPLFLRNVLNFRVQLNNMYIGPQSAGEF